MIGSKSTMPASRSPLLKASAAARRKANSLDSVSCVWPLMTVIFTCISGKPNMPPPCPGRQLVLLSRANPFRYVLFLAVSEASMASPTSSTGAAPSIWPSSNLARVRRSSTRRPMRPASRSIPFIARCRSSGRDEAPSSNSCAYAETAAIGVRSSWDASPTKRRRRLSEALKSLKKGLDTPEHDVEGRCEVADLGSGVGVGGTVHQVPT